MAIDRAGALIDLIREHHLLEAAQLEELGRTPDVSETPSHLLGQCLIELGWLTPYQVDCLMQQRMGELVLGAYHLLDRLGQGETGPVFQARKPGKAGIVVLKTIPKTRLADPQLLARFQQEVRIAAQLQHPNIAPVSAVGQHGQLFLFAREFVPGADLGRMVRELGPLPPFLACNAVRQAALSVQFAHEKGLSHRRVKAFNLIVVDQPGTDGTVKLVDFGLGQLTAGATAGLDVAGDLTALGQTLCFLLTGQTSPSAAENLPAELGEIVRRLAPTAANRFATAGEVADALSPFCHEPPPAPVPSDGGITATAAAPAMALPIETPPVEQPQAVPLEGIAVPVMGTVGVAVESEEPTVAPPLESPPAISAEAAPIPLGEMLPPPPISEPAIAAPLFAESAAWAPELPALSSAPSEAAESPLQMAEPLPALAEPIPAISIESSPPMEAFGTNPLMDAPYAPPSPAGLFTDQPPPATAITAEEPSSYPMGEAAETAPRPMPPKKGWRKKDIMWVIVGSVFWLIAGILVVIIIMLRSNRADPPKNNRPGVPAKQKSKSRAQSSFTRSELRL